TTISRRIHRASTTPRRKADTTSTESPVPSTCPRWRICTVPATSAPTNARTAPTSVSSSPTASNRRVGTLRLVCSGASRRRAQFREPLQHYALERDAPVVEGVVGLDRLDAQGLRALGLQ